MTDNGDSGEQPPRQIGTARSGAAYRDRARIETSGAWNSAVDSARIIDDPETLLSCLAERLEGLGPFHSTGEVGAALARLVLIANAALSGPAELGAAVAAMQTLLDDIAHQR